MNWNIFLTDPSATTRFAADEFSRLIKRMDEGARVAFVTEKGTDTIEIGLNAARPVPAVDDPTLDDAIAISVKDGCGYITGSNERSVLIAVYKFFEAAGVSYVRPGRDGERIPKRDSKTVAVTLTEKAAARYRGICPEGSAGYEHIADIVDFAPKMGMNIIFTQLWRPSFMFDRWYGNEKSPSGIPHKLSVESQDAIIAEYDKQATLRGLDHQRMGHGWIPSILGEKTGHWHGISAEGLLKDEHRELVAEIGGKRELFNGSAVDTSFCYGNPKARRLIVEEAVKYAEAHPEVKTLHFWLADQPSNQCECPLCRDTLPSDFYIDMCNELDAELTARGITTRIVFLAYLELLWTPERARIKNPDRFILLFAPIRRPYERPLLAQSEGEMPAFLRNVWRNPCDNFSVLKSLQAWQAQFPGECVLFDYHLMWDVYNDLGGEQVARMLGRDMVDLPKSGMNGMISCQGIRIGMTGAISMRLMANALWHGTLDDEAETARFYNEAYGEGGEAVRALLKTVTAALDPNMLRGKTPITKSHIDTCNTAKAAIAAFSPTLASGIASDDYTVRVGYLYLAEQLRLDSALIDFLISSIEGDDAKGRKLWQNCLALFSEIESLYPRALDAFELSLVWHRHVIPVLFPTWKINYDSGELTM